MRYGLLGEKLGHSYSPQIHSQLGDYQYDLYEVSPAGLEDFLKTDDFSGLNVTIPYKKAVIPYCSELSPVAQKLGSVNTILRMQNGSLVGHNTDYYGFTAMVQKTGIDVAGKKCLVLGSGGASATAVCVLEEMGAQVIVVSRRGENNYENLILHSDAAMIVNATPVGMYPHNGQTCVDLSIFPRLEAVLDLIYNPARTQLLLDAERRGIPAMNGLLMLVAQAKESAEWFTGRPIEDAKIFAIYHSLQMQMQNIILIGMPGCGKSAVAKQLAARLSRKAVDADALIESLAGKSIPQIFTEEGESGFREWETKALSELGKRSGLVIATGGGCVTKERNYPLLHQNGTCFWIQRDILSLPTDGRPLSQQTDLAQMYKLRQPLYASFADHTILNDGKIEDTVQKIIDIWEESR